MFISGTTGHATEDTQHKYPYMVDGHLLKLNFTKPIYELHLQQGTGGTIAGSPVSGVSGTQFNLSATPANKYTFDGFSASGTELTGSAGKFNNSDVTVNGSFTYHPAWEPVGGAGGEYSIHSAVDAPATSVPWQSAYIWTGIHPKWRNGHYEIYVSAKNCAGSDYWCSVTGKNPPETGIYHYDSNLQHGIYVSATNSVGISSIKVDTNELCNRFVMSGDSPGDSHTGSLPLCSGEVVMSGTQGGMFRLIADGDFQIYNYLPQGKRPKWQGSTYRLV